MVERESSAGAPARCDAPMRYISPLYRSLSRRIKKWATVGRRRVRAKPRSNGYGFSILRVFYVPFKAREIMLDDLARHTFGHFETVSFPFVVPANPTGLPPIE